MTLAYPALVSPREGDDVLLALVKERHALDPSILDERPPFFFRAEISSDRLDAYFTHMLPSTLRNYAVDAAEGVPLQDSHNVYALSLGRSLTGSLEVLPDGITRVVSDFYIVPGLNLGTSTDDVIVGLRSGVVKDVSVGFNGGRFLCDVCGRDLLRSDCPHIPGFDYIVEAEDGRKVKTATAGIDDAHLTEVSAVYAGATPGAAVLKATSEAEAGRLRPSVARLIEQRYRVRLPDRRVVVPGVQVPPVQDKERDMDKVRAILDALSAYGVGETSGDDVLDQVRALGDERDALAGRVRELETEVQRLAPLADQGTRYREFLVSETMSEGVRALGEAFPAETMRVMLEGANLATVESLLDHYRGIAAGVFPGGRRTVEGNESDKQESEDTGEDAGDLPAPAPSDVVFKG